MSEFSRVADGFPFTFLGMKTNTRPDLLPPGKYPIAINIRAYTQNRIEGRPGVTDAFTIPGATAAQPPTDIRAIVPVATGNPNSRLFERDTTDTIYIDTGVAVGTLNPSSSGGATLIPFRPSESVSPWMYIANGADYQKFSAPTLFFGTGGVTAAKVGIAEPQTAPDAAIAENFQTLVGSPVWTNAGTAGSPSSSNRVSDTAGTVLQDPTGAAVWTVEVSSTVVYQKLMQVTIGPNVFLVMDVFASLPSAITIQSIFYFSGTTGHCVIVPAAVAAEGGEDTSIFSAAFISTIRRGAMIQVGAELCYVWSVTSGPDGSISIETSTTGAHTTSDTLSTVPAISVVAAAPVRIVTAPAIATTVTQSSNTFEPGGGGGVWSASPSLQAALAALDNNLASVNIGPGNPYNYSQLLNLSGFGFAIPGTATILGVICNVYGAANPNDNITVPHAVLNNPGGPTGTPNTTSLPLNFTTAITRHTFGSPTDSWNTPLTPADVNNPAFGVSAYVSTFVFNPQLAVIDWINLSVAYTLPNGGGAATPPIAGQAITDPDTTYQVTTGSGTSTSQTISPNPFNIAGSSFQPEDYISIGIQVDTLANLTEVKFLLDVDDGSFTKNFYYYTIRPSDIAAAVAGTATQLATSQTVAQRANIDAEVAAIDAQAGYFDVNSGQQTSPGTSQWSQIVFPVSALIRVGNSQTKSLQTLAKIQFLWTATGTINVAVDIPFVFGNFQADVGDVGEPYRYRLRPRSKANGVVGNPSPATRYGVSPRRGEVTVYCSGVATPDPQMDTWDVFRFGGTVTEWRYAGSVPYSPSAIFVDNYSDDAVGAGDALDFDNFEPWPTVDVPNIGSANIVNGTVVVLTTTDTDIVRYLPGTLIQLGGSNVYTLYARPTLISGSQYLVQLVENAGAGTNIPYSIQEPSLAREFLPYMFGPDQNGTVFATGDPFRPGTLYYSKNYAPDNAPDTYNQEIVQPSEPLIGGEIVDGIPFVASSERWWQLYPTPDNPAQRYSAVQIPIPRGIAAPFGHCTDGVEIFFWAKDGIYGTQRGSLTDADLYNLFPHDGVVGSNYAYGGKTIFAPNYGQAQTFRLIYNNGYLYAIYQDAGDNYRMLVCNLRTGAWSADQYSIPVSAAYSVEQPASVSPGNLNDDLILGAWSPVTGIVHFGNQTVNVNDFENGGISCAVAVPENSGGDLRAPKQWGDYFLDAVPAAAVGITIQPLSLGNNIAGASAGTMAQSGVRTRLPFTLGANPVVSHFFGSMFTWTDNYATQTVPTQLLLWCPTFVVQPASVIGFTTFGSSFELPGYMHIREVVIAYVAQAAVTLQFTSYDGQSPAAVVLPSTGGAYQKTLFPLSANKGQLYRLAASCASPFQIFFEDSEIRVGEWNRMSPYHTFRDFGAVMNGVGKSADPGPV